MKVLIACEESQTVCLEFRKRGHEAYSNDIIPCSGNHPEWHLQMDARKALYSRKWDLVIAHPPCTRLANSGVRWLASRKPRAGYEWDSRRNLYMRTDENIWVDFLDAAQFFSAFTEYGQSGNKIAIENPIQHSYAREFIPSHHQIIQPWHFGHGETKATCLWLYGLPKLQPTNIVSGREQRIWRMGPSPERQALRSKTFTGIAEAMSDQWGN